MASNLPTLYLVRHGDTDWSDSHQHTGRTDLPLNTRGEERARKLAGRLQGMSFARVFTSPLQRAAKTCELAGFSLTGGAQIDPDLLEWDYGQFEGKVTGDIVKVRPGWELFRDGCPGGETPEQVAARADRFIAKVLGGDGNAVAFSSGHISRMVAARWLGLPSAAGRFFFCDPASISVLGFEHDDRDEPVVRLWNSTDPMEEPRTQ